MIKVLMPNTEILTQTGWKSIKQISKMDNVAQYTNDNHIVRFNTLNLINKERYELNVVRVKNGINNAFEIPSFSAVPIITKNRKGMFLEIKKPEDIKFTSSTNFLTGGLSNSERKILTDYELSCMVSDEMDWINYGTLSFKLIDTILARFDSEQKKDKVVYTSKHKEVIRMLLALSGRTSKVSKNTVTQSNTNLLSASKMSSEMYSYDGEVYVIDTKFTGVIARMNDTIIVL